MVLGLDLVAIHAHDPSKLGGRMTGSGVRCNLTLAERSCVCPSLYILISEVGVRGRSHGGIFHWADSRRIPRYPRQMAQKAAPKRSPETTQTQHNTAQHTNTQHNVHRFSFDV